MDWLDGFAAHWVWLTLGLVLAGLEMLLPGVYLIWLAVAAIVTGVLTLTLDLSLPFQIIDFVSLSLIIAFSAKRFLSDKPIESSDPLMNRRGALVAEPAGLGEAEQRVEGNSREQSGARGSDVRIGGAQLKFRLDDVGTSQQHV